MSDARGSGFYQIDNSILDKHAAIIGVYGLAVYNVIVRFADQHGKAFPSHQTVADLLGISRRKVIDAMTVLVEVGLLQKQKRLSQDGDATSNMYTLFNVGSASHALGSASNGEVVNDMHHGSACGALGVVHVVHTNNTQLEQYPLEPQGVEDLDGITAAQTSQSAPVASSPAQPIPVEEIKGDLNDARIRLDDPTAGSAPTYFDNTPLRNGKPEKVAGVDVRKLGKDKLIPPGQGETPVEVWREYYTEYPTPAQVRELNATVDSPEKLVAWRVVVKERGLKGWKSFGNVYDVFVNGEKPQSNGRYETSGPTRSYEFGILRPKEIHNGHSNGNGNGTLSASEIADLEARLAVKRANKAARIAASQHQFGPISPA